MQDYLPALPAFTFPALEMLALHTLQVAVQLFVVLRIKYVQTKDLVS